VHKSAGTIGEKDKIVAYKGMNCRSMRVSGDSISGKNLQVERGWTGRTDGLGGRGDGIDWVNGVMGGGDQKTNLADRANASGTKLIAGDMSSSGFQSRLRLSGAFWNL